MSAPADAWPTMTLPVELIRCEDGWPYDTHVAAGYGIARLLVWTMPTGHVAALTGLGNGASITNSAEHIWAALVEQYGRQLVLLEHYRATGTGECMFEEHLDQVEVRGGRPRWRRIWPTSPSHPQHAQLRRWIDPLHELSDWSAGGAR